jgi:hypothetical protein
MIAIPMEGGIAATAMATSVDSTGKSAAMGTAIEAEIGTGIGTVDATATGTIFAHSGIASPLMTATGTAGIRADSPHIGKTRRLGALNRRVSVADA